MSPARPLYMLACDHRASFRRTLFGEDTLTPEILARTSDAKRIVFDGLSWAIGRGVDRADSGLLMDTETGEQVVAAARRAAVRVAIPVERGGAQPVFQLNHGEAFDRHIEEHDPSYVKALTYFNPEGDRAANAVQGERLGQLSRWVRAVGRELMVEFMVPATPQQLRSVGGDMRRYDIEVRPGLMLTTIRQLHAFGVYPRMWKLEGLDSEDDCRQVIDQCQDGADDEVSCLVLGRGADISQVHHWLATAARVPGYDGFVVGRSIWLEPLLDYVADRADRDATVERIGTRYTDLVRVFENAASEATRTGGSGIGV